MDRIPTPYSIRAQLRLTHPQVTLMARQREHAHALLPCLLGRRRALGARRSRGLGVLGGRAGGGREEMEANRAKGKGKAKAKGPAPALTTEAALDSSDEEAT